MNCRKKKMIHTALNMAMNDEIFVDFIISRSPYCFKQQNAFFGNVINVSNCRWSGPWNLAHRLLRIGFRLNMHRIFQLFFTILRSNLGEQKKACADLHRPYSLGPEFGVCPQFIAGPGSNRPAFEQQNRHAAPYRRSEFPSSQGLPHAAFLDLSEVLPAKLLDAS